ncbi:LacI family DNA-binding transcriptional regulator [Isoptericola sp. b490]|uniref:LacI family DNA-binding transcriptional regulator n=1 Tax=Actinotalea lenta TaxID=3064654 RepID=UPI002712E236|nr:LacI family DNA-binding transcriptional regulator [Isoptericola sp. b490]MDO8119822.1 LacI family DNA-binding transcriptional regulator [Isoptericola sp. b490]
MATIADVAREAGVSISTVSYALSGKRSITEDTRVRVLAAAARLGYAPKAAARALAARRSQIIAVTTPLHPDTDHSAHMAFAMAVTTAARDHDYDTLLLVQDDALEGMRRSAATSLADGIVVLDVAAHDERADLARSLGCPVVFIGLPADTGGLTCVDLDFRAAAHEAVDTLHAAGHRTVGLVSQPVDVIAREANYPLRIEQAFAERADELGLTHALVRPDLDAPHAVLDDLLRLLPEVTAIVLSTPTSVAVALTESLSRRGLRVPDDLSVVTVGMTADPSRPPLPFDSLPLDPALTCPVAVDTLVGLIEGATSPGGVTLVPPTHVSRGSVAPAPVPHPTEVV